MELPPCCDVKFVRSPQARKDVFLSVLSRDHTQPSCCRSSSQPHTPTAARAYGPATKTFRDLCKRDPEFASLSNRLRQATGRVEAEIVNQAFTLDERPIFDRQGNRIGTQTSSNASNQMLLRLAENAFQLIKKVIGRFRLRSLRTEDATICLKVTSVWIQAVARHQQVFIAVVAHWDGWL